MQQQIQHRVRDTRRTAHALNPVLADLDQHPCSTQHLGQVMKHNFLRQRWLLLLNPLQCLLICCRDFIAYLLFLIIF